VCFGGSEGCESKCCWQGRETIRRGKGVSTAVHSNAGYPVCCVGGVRGVSCSVIGRG